MPKSVTLRAVTIENWERVAKLKLHKSQKDYVYSNLYSLAESRFNPHAVPLAIYAGKKVVGFFMYETWTEDGEPNTFSIYRFMIDRKRQGKGYGRAAMEELLARLRVEPECRRIVICYVASNAVAKRFYESFGFREIGLDDDGEMIAEIRL